MACYSIKRVISKLRNIFARSTAIQTPESSRNLSDKSSRDAGNNGEKGGVSPRVL